MSQVYSVQELDKLYKKTTKRELFELAFSFAQLIAGSEDPKIICGEMEKEIATLKINKII